MNSPLTLYTNLQYEEMQAFIRLHFGESEWTSRELDSTYVHTDTMLISPEGRSRTLVTCGMGARRMNSPTEVKRVELVISASSAVDVVEHDGFLLAGEITHISKYPFRENAWLEAGDTINASLDFQERFGYAYFAFWDLDLAFRPVDMEEDVHFIAAVPIYEEEHNWIQKNNVFAFFLHLYDTYGDAMFHADCPREVCIPDWDEEEQVVRLMMQQLDMDLPAAKYLVQKLNETAQQGESLTQELWSTLLLESAEGE